MAALLRFLGGDKRDTSTGPDGCWIEGRGFLWQDLPGIGTDRCRYRMASRPNAKAACLSMPGCGGIQRNPKWSDCGGHQYELRSGVALELGYSGMEAWVRESAPAAVASNGRCSEMRIKTPREAFSSMYPLNISQMGPTPLITGARRSSAARVAVCLFARCGARSGCAALAVPLPNRWREGGLVVAWRRHSLCWSESEKRAPTRPSRAQH